MLKKRGDVLAAHPPNHEGHRRANMATPKLTAEQRFWSKVQVAGPDECWLWTGAKNRGHGCINFDGRSQGTHRVSWQIHFGPIPVGDRRHDTCICHHCDVRACVNPAHLFLGTQRDNILDRDAKGRRGASKGPAGERSGAAKLTEVLVREIFSLSGSGYTQAEIGKRYGITGQHVGFIWHKKTWKCLGL